jgi:hypothetical protein
VTVYRGASLDPGDDKILVLEGLGANSRVQRLDADGNFELAWGKNVVRPGAPGDTGDGHEICRRAESCKAGPAGDGRGELDRPTGLAVNPATGSVYVADRGNQRVEEFRLGGRPLDSWPLESSDAEGDLGRLAIATAPRPPHDVFVAEQRANRVLQLTAQGRFVRGWGWGVASGKDKFETCTSIDRCRAGRPVADGAGSPRGWPTQIAVDDAGVVYGSVFYGSIFPGPQQRRTRIVRFRSEPAPDAEDATDSLLAPLTPLPYDSFDPREVARRLTNGTTLGLDFATDGQLLAINNPFGTSKIDFVTSPAANGGDRPAVRVAIADSLPFLQNVRGIAAGSEGVTYLSSGTVHQRTGTSTFTGCAHPNARRDCHGLVVLAVGGKPDAVIAPSPGIAPPGALIAPGGVATYQFEGSDDGRAWRPLGRRRSIAGTGYEWVPAPAARPTAGSPRWIRVKVTKRTESGIASTVSSRMRLDRSR